MSLLRELRPGRIYWRCKQTFGHGLRTAYYRDFVRRRILSTRPISCDANGPCEIHALTSQRDWLNLIWTLKTFYHYSKRRYPLCIHDDGTLSPIHTTTLARHFPAARIILRAEADRVVGPALADKPRSQAFRNSNALALKVFDTAVYLRADRMLLLDCDLLFFECPSELLRRVDDGAYSLNTFNQDWGDGYSVGAAAVRSTVSVELAAQVNSGLGLMHRSSLDLDAYEDYLGIEGILSHNWRIEQTLIGIACSRHGYAALPEEYDVRLGPDDCTLPVRHYTSPIRHLMYSAGIRRLVASGFLRELTR